MYAQQMELFSRIFSVLGELAHLARALFTHGMRFIALLARSCNALAAENIFLRKQLAFYQERKVAPRRFDNVSRMNCYSSSGSRSRRAPFVSTYPKARVDSRVAINAGPPLFATMRQRF